MPPALFARCKFYDLADALTHLATGAETRSFCSAVCKQGFVPVGVDGSVKGWQEDFYRASASPTWPRMVSAASAESTRW